MLFLDPLSNSAYLKSDIDTHLSISTKTQKVVPAGMSLFNCWISASFKFIALKFSGVGSIINLVTYLLFGHI
jgi:hypothetical protein